MRPVGDSGEAKAGRKPNGQWAKGTSGNPGGRPLGFLKKIERELEKEFERDVNHADKIASVVITRAANGDDFCLKLALERMWPVVKQLEVTDTTERQPLEIPDNAERDKRVAKLLADTEVVDESQANHPGTDTTQ